MTAMQSLLVALKSLVTLEQSEFHRLLTSASDQHDAEQKELDELRMQVAALGTASAPVDLSGLASGSDLAALAGRVDGIDTAVGQVTSAVADLQVAAAADAAAVTADTPALLADPDLGAAADAADTSGDGAADAAAAAADAAPADSTAATLNADVAAGDTVVDGEKTT